MVLVRKIAFIKYNPSLSNQKTDKKLMEHVLSHVKIYSTIEHGRFNLINGNRPLDELKIKRIVKEIQSGNDMLEYYPIQVVERNGRLDILDGQHRFYICRKLKRPVFYIIVDDIKTMSEIARINSNVGKWKASDYINCYIQQDNQHYIRLRDFLDKYQVAVSTALKLLYVGSPGTEGTDIAVSSDFKNGLFQIRHYEFAVELMETVKRFMPFQYVFDRSFIIAVYKIKKAALVSIDELVSRIEKRSDMLTKQASYKEYIYLLEQIFNMGKQNRVVIV